MGARACFWLSLLACASGVGLGTASADVGWMQPGVRVWYLGAVDGGGITSSNAEEAYLVDAVVGGNLRVVHHSALTHWTSPRPVETGTYPIQDMGPCWIHPQRLQTLQLRESWMGQEITLIDRRPYTYDTFPYHLLPIKALFDLRPQREIVKLSYMIEQFSVGNAYFDAETGLLLYHHALWGANKMFFMLAEINYDFATHAAYAEDDGPHTGFRSFVSEQSLGSSYGVGGGSVISQSLVETRHGASVEMRVLTAITAPSWPAGTGQLTQADENYCFFGAVPIVRRMNATQAPNFPPEQWNPFGQYLWWWLPSAVPSANVFDVPMSRTSDQPRTYTATQTPARFHFTKLVLDSAGYMTAFAAKDPTTGLDVKPGDIAFQNLNRVDGLAYYQNTMARRRAWFDFSVWALGSGAGNVETTIPGLQVSKAGAGLVEASASAEEGTAVTLTATPAEGSVFSGWAGATDCVDGSVTLSAATTCVATFTLAPPTVESFAPGRVLVNRGERTWVEWAAEPGTAVALDGTPVATAGSVSVAPTQVTTYRLTATGAGGTQTAIATIHVRDGQLGIGTPVPLAPIGGEVIGVAGVTFSWTTVAGVGGYGLRVFRNTTGQTVFSGSLAGAGATSTLIALPDGAFTFAVRGCTVDFEPANCGPWGTVDFGVRLARPATSPVVTFPAAGAVISSSTNTFSWTAVPGAASYEVTVRRATDLKLVSHVRTLPPETSTVLTLRSGQYVITVEACDSACGPAAPYVPFEVVLPPPPTLAPAVNFALLNGNLLTVDWGSVTGADLYQVEVVQPPPAGPGGGALTVASRQTAATSATFPVPAGVAYVLVRACNGDGCGSQSPAVAIDSRADNPSTPQIGSPMAVIDVPGPVVLLSWSRVPGDIGGNTWYRLYVQDLARAATALDVLTTQNFYGASFMAEGTRYDAIVTAHPFSDEATTGGAVGFVVTGTSSLAPTMVAPTHQSTVHAGNVQLGWTPVAGGTLYEYYVAVRGQPRATVRGVTTGLFVQVPLTVSADYSGIVRACPAGASCSPDSDAEWGPWSINAGPGVANFTVVP